MSDEKLEEQIELTGIGVARLTVQPARGDRRHPHGWRWDIVHGAPGPDWRHDIAWLRMEDRECPQIIAHLKEAAGKLKVIKEKAFQGSLTGLVFFMQGFDMYIKTEGELAWLEIRFKGKSAVAIKTLDYDDVLGLIKDMEAAEEKGRALWERLKPLL
jgi:hypothetical protein